ncbi:MAG: tRNA (adenosine(37)-N6)-threonylcarbamoyltransferase complex transferase subunit TsaD [Pseudomonadota bacterium]
MSDSTAPTVLGIEASCDETAASVVVRSQTGEGNILSNVVLSQIDEHAAFGGVVPEIAARAHLDAMDGVVRAALHDADKTLNDIDAIAVTAGPGLAGGLIVGSMTAKALAFAANKPLLAINHLEGHALTPRLTSGVTFPYLLLLVSGGHSQIVLVRDVGDYERWATTIDDALGEAFDKTAKLLSLPYPGGPNVEKAAKDGNAARFRFPRPLSGEETLNMSFSGLKTAVRLEAERNAPLDDQAVGDLCASFQSAVCDVVADRVKRSIDRYRETVSDIPNTLIVAGGVAANLTIRTALEDVVASSGWQFEAPPLNLCTDNAAMIAWAGAERFARGETHGLDFEIRPRWPLDADSQTVVGSGKRGAKV